MFLIQHGWGKGARMSRALDTGAQGVIVGLSDETPESTASLVSGLHERDVEVLVDPQLYVLAIADSNVKKLDQYPFGGRRLRVSDFTPRNVARLVRDVVDYQADLPVTRIIAPGVIQLGLRDEWAQINRSLAAEAADYSGDSPDGKPLLVTLVISEEGLTDRELMHDYIDLVTEIECAGFYVVVSHSSPYSLDSAPATLVNWMLLIRGLALNGYEVLCGYADLQGVLARAAGAHGFASGWSQGLRRFTPARWLPAGGGRPALKRYTSARLLGHLLVETELNAVEDRGALARVVGSTPLDRDLRRRGVDGVAWTPEAIHVQYLAACAELDGQLDIADPRERVAHARELIARATSTVEALRNDSRVILETRFSHLASWATALDDFALEVGLAK